MKRFTDVLQLTITCEKYTQVYIYVNKCVWIKVNKCGWFFFLQSVKKTFSIAKLQWGIFI